MGNVLVNRQTSLGDVICVEPFLRALHLTKEFDHITIDTQFPEVFYNHPINFFTKEIEYNKVCDLSLVYENKLHLNIVDAYLDKYNLNLSDKDKIPRLYLTQEEKEYGFNKLNQKYKWVIFDFGYPMTPDAFLKGYDNDKYVMWQRAFWPIEQWMAIINFVKYRRFNTVAIGNRLEAVPKAFIDLNLIGQTNIRQLFSVINASTYFVGMDSGPMHIAKAFDKKGIAIFNPNHSSSKLLQKGSSITPLHRYINDDINHTEIINVLKKIINGENAHQYIQI